MADQKISTLTELTTINAGDLILVSEDDGGGVYTTSKKYDLGPIATLLSNTSGTNTGDELPDQTGNSGKFLTTNGSVVTWSAISEMTYPGSGIAVSTGSAWDTSKTAPSGAIVGTTDSQTLTNKTLTDPELIGCPLEDIYTITDGAAFEIDPGNGTIQLITLGASRTPKGTNFANGEAITLLVDDGTDYTLTWTDTTFGASGVIWKTDGGSAPTLNTSGYTIITLFKVGNQVYGLRGGDN